MFEALLTMGNKMLLFQFQLWKFRCHSRTYRIVVVREKAEKS